MWPHSFFKALVSLASMGAGVCFFVILPHSCEAHGAGPKGPPSPATVSAPQKCQEDVLDLDVRVLDEASGLARAPGGGFYVMNDSGDQPRFFRVETGRPRHEEFKIAQWKPFDPEALRVSSCPAGMAGNCLLIADIGDNRSRRKHVEIAYFVADRLKRSGPNTPDFILRFRYPDGAHNAEGFAPIENGREILIVTKEQDSRSRRAKPAKLFTVSTNEVVPFGARSSPGKVSWHEPVLAKFRGEWNVPEWVSDSGLGGLVTDIDVFGSAEGRARVLLLTYQKAIEVETTWTLGGFLPDRKRVYDIDAMEQQEAIAYDDKGQGFYFTSEAPLSFLNLLGANARVPIRYFRPDQCGGRSR